MIRKTLLILAILITTNNLAFAIYKNDLRTLFLNNKANICGINIRTFNAQDTNKDEIINNNEVSGNFINAIDRLDEIKALNINTLHVLPITPVGKLKALGTAGSVYAISNFWSINPQLVDKTSELTDVEQAKLFITECHKRNIKVVIDLPSCGSYDLFLTNPELFIKNEKQCSIVPTDWTDVRLLNTGNDQKLNQDVLNAHKKFIDFIIELGADGIRADVATIKPYKFWVEIIEYTREKSPEFMFLAEASDSWREAPSKFAEFTPYDKLLEAGFDGYYGSFFNLKDWKTSEEFFNHIRFNKKLLTSYKEPKSVIMSFTTHDEVSPIVLHGEQFSNMISWLEATLPFNPYIIDGFYSGDEYLYKWANTKAVETFTDDDIYFVHRGKLDIFNFSRKPGAQNDNILNNYKKASEFRNANIELITKGSFDELNSDNEQIFAFIRMLKDESIIVIGNLNYKNSINKVTIKVPNIKHNTKYENINNASDLKFKKGKIITNFSAGEIKIIKLRKVK